MKGVQHSWEQTKAVQGENDDAPDVPAALGGRLLVPAPSAPALGVLSCSLVAGLGADLTAAGPSSSSAPAMSSIAFRTSREHSMESAAMGLPVAASAWTSSASSLSSCSWGHTTMSQQRGPASSRTVMAATCGGLQKGW